MSKRICRSCHRYYPATRTDCPDCGPPWWRRPLTMPRWLNPGDRPRPAGNLREWIGVAVFIVLVIVAIRISHTQAERNEQEAQARAQAAAAADAACRADAQCWGRRHLVAATSRCKRVADRQAQYATRWPSGLFEPAFLAWQWRDQSAGTLVYVGRVELQNGFGAWAPYIVGCLFDSVTDTARDIELKPGRL